MVVLGVTRLQAWTTQVTEVDEIVNVVTREVECSLQLTTASNSFCNGAVSFSEGARSACSPYITWKLSPSDICITSVDEKNRVLSTRLTPPPLMVYVEVEYFVAEIMSGSGVKTSSGEGIGTCRCRWS